MGLVALPLLAVELLARAALADIAELARTSWRRQSHAALTVDEQGLALLETRGEETAIYRGRQRVAVVRGQSGFLDQVRLVEKGSVLLSADRGGEVVLTRLGLATSTMDGMSGASAAANRWLSSGIGRPLSRQALSFALRYRALELPDIAWGGPGGRFTDCSECPLMTVYRPGWAIVGRGWFENRSEPDWGRRRLIGIERQFAIARVPSEGSVASADRLWEIIVQLRRRSRRDYRLPTADELAYALAGGSEVDRFLAGDPATTPTLFVAVDFAAPDP